MSAHSRSHSCRARRGARPRLRDDHLSHDAVGHIDHKGRQYHFCSQSCLDQFRANPDAFLARRPAAATPRTWNANTRARWIGGCANEGPVRARNAGWRSNPLMCADHEGRVDVPDAPGDRARCAGRLPDLRNGARAPNGHARGDESRTRRHDAALLVVVGITAPILAFMVSEFVPGQPLQRRCRTAG